MSFVPKNDSQGENKPIRRMKTTSKSMRSAGWLIATATCAAQAFAAETLLQEGFNTDGTTSGRYTMTGRDVYEVPRIQAELNNFDQKGPIYFEHNSAVSFVGIPPIPDRRVIWSWRTDPNGGAATEDLLKVWDSTVDWLLTGKKNATVVVHPNAAAIGELADRLTSKGHTVVDDDPAISNENDVPGDLFIHGPASTNPSRFALAKKPVIAMNEADYDDLILGSIGTLATFDPGQVTIATASHPAAGGKTGSFTGWNTGNQPFGLTGNFIAQGATTVATVTRTVSPSVRNLQDVDAMIDGTKQNDKTTDTVSDIDFSDASGGSFATDNGVPGGYTGNWGLHITGKINVPTAGTYRVAVGSDDGARLEIDLDKNGFSAADIIIEDSGPHGHQFVFADVKFPSAGDYDFDLRSYNAGTGGSLEWAVANVPVPVPDDALDSGFWELVSTSSTLVKLKSAANVTAFTPTGPNVDVQVPLVVAYNGPNDTPPGALNDGGAFAGFEGTGFIAGAGMNKWPYPNGQTYRSVQLKPVNVAGKTNVKLTVALAATQIDFEDSDFVDILVYPNGANSTPVTLAHFRGVANGVQPWMADQKENFVRRLTKQFADFTYDVPPGATDLVVEVRVATTWWNEIVAFDNIRVTTGATSSGEEPKISVAKDGTDVVVTFTGSLERSDALGTGWQPVTATAPTYRIAASQLGKSAFFRAKK
jgi:hypothetical protein